MRRKTSERAIRSDNTQQRGRDAYRGREREREQREQRVKEATMMMKETHRRI